MIFWVLLLLLLLLLFCATRAQEFFTFDEYASLITNIHKKLSKDEQMVYIEKQNQESMDVMVYDTKEFILKMYTVTFEKSNVKEVTRRVETPMDDAMGIRDIHDIPVYLI